jgi:hypothetical protein
MAKPVMPPQSDEQKTTWDNIVFSTPVVLTVVATVLAGLSSSEMSQSQYFRSMAAQMQSKVGDQWAFFQAKRLRSLDDQNTLAILTDAGSPADEREDLGVGVSPQSRAEHVVLAMKQVQSAVGSASSNAILQKAQRMADALKQAATQPDGQRIAESYTSGKAPTLNDQPLDDPAVQDVMDSISAQASDAEVLEKVGKLKQEQIDQANDIAKKNSTAFDAAVAQTTSAASEIQTNLKQLSGAAEELVKVIAKQSQESGKSELADLREQIRSLAGGTSRSQLRFDVSRLEQEARYNQALAEVMEVQVRMDDYLSNRYRQRSREFFIGMLGAQAGVTVGTMSLALKKRRWLWFAAAAAGLFAVVFAGYVYLFV